MNLDTKQIRTKFEQEGFVVLPPTPGVWIKDVSDIFDGNVKADKHYLRVRTENGWNEHKDIQIVSETELFGETEVPWPRKTATSEASRQRHRTFAEWSWCRLSWITS